MTCGQFGLRTRITPIWYQGWRMFLNTVFMRRSEVYGTMRTKPMPMLNTRYISSWSTLP